MKFFNQCAAIGLAMTLLSSCSQDAPWGVTTGEGGLRLKVEAISNVKAAVPAVRAITTDVVTPPASQFEVSMVKEGGGYEQTWSSIAEFEEVTSFPVGNYILSAYYGDDSSQGTVASADLGYEHAQYYGETQVTIRENETTEVQLTVGLTNAIVVIEYTEAFKKYFKSYSTTVQSAGGDPLKLGDNEAMNYVQPGEMTIIISAVQQNDKELTLSPGKFDIEANHMYKLRYNIYNGEIGDAVLAIEFDDSLNVEPITINLSEELQSTRAPQVSTIGFEPGDKIVTLSGTPYLKDAKFSVVADGGISSAKLTINSDSFAPSYLKNGEIDLCSSSALENRAAMEADGIKAIGFHDNDGKMGEVDLSGLFSKLKEGEHSFSLLVTDKYTQSNDPVGCLLNCIPADMAVEGLDAIYGEGYADLRVKYNGPDPVEFGNPFSFSVKTSAGTERCDIKSISLEAESTRTDYPSHYYIYRIALPFIEDDTFNVNVLFNEDEAPCGPATVNFIFPNYNEYMEYDAMATRLRFRTNFSDPYKKKLFEDRMRVFVGGQEKEATFDNSINAYVIEGLSSGQSYEVKTSLQKADTPNVFGSSADITMEEAAPVPNGDFSQTQQTINQDLKIGGDWKYLGRSYSNYCKMQYSEPDGGWASINEKTFYTESSCKNTWFLVASTYMDGSDVVIRSVAYDHNGTEPAVSNSGVSVTHSYCQNRPDNISNRSAGELFLGSYSYKDNIESRSEGINFNGRPKSLNFSYKYNPYNADKGYLEVVLLDSDNNVVNSETITLEESSNKKDFILTLPSYKFGVKVSKLKIKFLSSTQDPVQTQNIEDIDLSLDNKSAGGTLKDVNGTHTYCRGSILTISSLEFKY